MGDYRAHYFDGRSAADRPVTVRPEGDGLRIEAEDGARLALWPYRDIEIVDEVVGESGLRLRRRGGAARLTVADPGLLGALPADLGAARQAEAKRRRLARNPLLVLAAICAAVVAVWAGFPLAVRASAAAIPPSWERALGDWVLEDVLEVLALFDDGAAEPCAAPAGAAALAALTRELAAAAEAPYEFRVRVVDVAMTNAFALPGGAIVVFGGLIDFAETPEEVAGVLAHEMAHVVKRHGTEVILRNYGLQLLVESLTGGAGGLAGGIGETLLGLSYSREAEREADETGLRLLQTAGLRADGLGRFFQRFGAAGGAAGGGAPAAIDLLSTHPSSESRAALAERAGTEGRPAMSEADWRALKGICGPAHSDAAEDVSDDGR